MLLQVLRSHVLNISHQMGRLFPQRIGANRRVRDHYARNRQQFLLQRLVLKISLIGLIRQEIQLVHML